MPRASSFDPFRKFKFRIKIDGNVVAGLTKCSALTVSVASQDFRSGDMDSFKQKVKLVFVSYGSREVDGGGNRGRAGRGGAFGGDPKAATEALQAAGVNTHYYISPLTAHEWQSWRRSLHEFAPLLFKD